MKFINIHGFQRDKFCGMRQCSRLNCKLVPGYGKDSVHNQIILFAAAAAVLTVFTAANIFDILLVVIVVEGKRLLSAVHFHFPRNQLQCQRGMVQVASKER